MPLDSAATWGAAIAAAIKAVPIPTEDPITDADLEAIWEAIVDEHTTQLGKSDVAPGTFAGLAPVTGVGGPVT